jgi:hypothetical protein
MTKSIEMIMWLTLSQVAIVALLLRIYAIAIARDRLNQVTLLPSDRAFSRQEEITEIR